MVALLILSLALILSFRVILQAERVVDLAVEVRAANALLAERLRNAPRSFEPTGGARQGFDWSAMSFRTGAERPIEVCHRRIDITNLESGRRYWAATHEACPSIGPSPPTPATP